MKKIIILLFCWLPLSSPAQTIDTMAHMSAMYFKEAEIAAKDQKLWPVKIYGPTLFVNPQTRMAYANEPDTAGILKKDVEIYKGLLPKNVMLANTAINWQGKLWAVILWPLPRDRNERLNLILHESFHRIQEKIGFPMHSPTADHLGAMNGRIYFLLELQALRAALEKPVDKRQEDLTTALLFRAKRQQLFPHSFNNENILEMNEGLAEYTGVMLGREKNLIREHLYDVIDHVARRKTLIRSSAYITGPVYGYLLYESNPDWTLGLDSSATFSALMEKNYHLKLPAEPIDKEVTIRTNHYNGKDIIASEMQIEKDRQHILDGFIVKFTKQPVLSIKLLKMNIGFDPDTLFDLGEYGTVYPKAEITDLWGKLTVSEGGVLMKDWTVIKLTAGDGISVNGQEIQGEGWKILLKDGWKMIKNVSGNFSLTEEK